MRFDTDRDGAAGWLGAARRYVRAFDAGALPRQEPVRVLLSGFGRFDMHAVNATSELIGGLRGPGAQLFGQPDDDRINALVGAHSLLASERLKLPTGGAVQLVTMVLPTLWDVAPALLLKVAAALRPQLVVMNGIMGASGHLAIETGARNRASPRTDASEALACAPGEPQVVGAEPLDHVLDMTVDFVAFEQAARSSLAAGAAVREQGRPLSEVLTEVRPQLPGRAENAYVCNATSYAVLAGLGARTPLRLLEGAADHGVGPDAIALPPFEATPPAAVFLHWPSDLQGEHLSVARGSLLAMVAAQLRGAAV